MYVYCTTLLLYVLYIIIIIYMYMFLGTIIQFNLFLNPVFPYLQILKSSQQSLSCFIDSFV